VTIRIHVFGASGSGTTTLGRALSQRLGVPHFDTDDFFWVKTDPPYQTSRAVPERQAMLRAALDGAPSGWVVSGSLVKWGDVFIPRFDLVVFLTLPAGIRLARLRAREVSRYGDAAIAPGGWAHTMHTEFLDWAARYDSGGLDVRSLATHEAWLTRVACPVLRLDSRDSVAALVQAVLCLDLSAASAALTTSCSSKPPA
jgi:adenylate kinase family enzyme